MPKINFYVLLVFFLFCSSLLFGAEVVNKVIAVVGEDTILKSDFDKVAEPFIKEYSKISPELVNSPEKVKELEKEILNQMINEKLILEEARKENVKVTERELEEAVKDIKSRFSSDEEFRQELGLQGFTEDEFKEKTRDQIQMMKLITRAVKDKIVIPTDEEAKEYYYKNRDKMVEPEAVRIRHVLIKCKKGNKKEEQNALKRIKKVQKELADGGDFISLAKEFSEDQNSAPKGGDLGLFVRGIMEKPFEEAAFSLNVGDISDIVQTEYGYHIIRCEEKRLAQKKSFDEVKDVIKQLLYREEMEKQYNTWIESLRKDTRITINF